jgi:hypothetical protein
MSENLDKLERMLEQATAAQGQAQDGLDPEAASLGEAWIAFGRLLEAAEAPVEPAIGHWAMPRPTPGRRWLLPAAALLAASLLIGIATTWTFRSTIAPSSPVGQVAKLPPPTPATGPQWDDSWDEQIAQVGRNVIYAQQDLYAGPDPLGAVQYGIEQMQQDVEGSKL